MILCALAAILLLIAAPAHGQTPLTNADVIRKIKSDKLPAVVVVEQIKTNPGRYDVSDGVVKMLIQDGIPGEVVAAMIAANEPNKGLVQNGEDLSWADKYLKAVAGGTTKMITPKKFRLNLGKGLALASLTYGMTKVSSGYEMDGSSAEVRLKGLTELSIGIPERLAPEETIMIREATVKKDKRMAILGSGSVLTGSKAKEAVSARFTKTTSFRTSNVNMTLWKITFDSPLPAGEYFVIFGGIMAWDFAIEP